MDIEESGRHDPSRRIDDVDSGEPLADGDHFPAVDRHVGPSLWRPGAVDDRAALYDELSVHPSPTIRVLDD